ncbi:MAG: ABC transporter ATP-binding protein [Pseudomonadota bacterium]|nr:ABC transporter ATP-binding protein [Pseudomonadota bacterium]
MKAKSVEVKGLSAGYGQTTVLEDVSFTVPTGTCTAIVGRNGMGKTTLLATLMGLTNRIRGDIKLGGEAIETAPTWRRAMSGLAYVPQTRDCFPTLTVEENLIVGIKDADKSSIEDAYALFPRLKERRRNLGNQLSGGEQQMLSTARSLLGKPSVVLLDEPLEGLAPVICQELMAAFSKLATDGEMTVLLVEQRVTSAVAIAQNVLVLERGRVAWHDSAEAWTADPTLTDRFLGVGQH